MFERCEISGLRFTIDRVVTFEISNEGLKLTADRPIKIVLPWDQGGTELSEWIGRLID